MVTATNLNAYEDSAEFDEDMSDLKEMANDIQIMVNKPEFEEYMIATARNFGGDAWTRMCRLRKVADDLQRELLALEEELVRVSQ